MSLITLLSNLLLGAAAAASSSEASVPNSTPHQGSSPPIYSPARPPSLPLAVRTPYTSAWTTTASASTLNTASVRFWTGSALGWVGIVVVDGVAYRYLGDTSTSTSATASGTNQTVPATPQTVTYDSSFSNFTFAAGPVLVEASFFSPVTPRDLCRAAIPLSYLTTKVWSADARAHDVRFYSDVDLAWVAAGGGRNRSAVWELHGGGGGGGGGGGNDTTEGEVYTWLVGLETPLMFGEEDELPLWGNFSYSTSRGGAVRFGAGSGGEGEVRGRFHVSGWVGNENGTGEYRGQGSGNEVFAFSHDFGNVSRASVRYTIGSIQTPVVNYRNSVGLSALRPWWQDCYGDVYAMIKFHWHDFADVQALAEQFESRLTGDIARYYEQEQVKTSCHDLPSGHGPQTKSCFHEDEDQDVQPYLFDPNSAYGFLNPTNFSGVSIPGISEPHSYYAIAALSARQAMAGSVYAAGPGSGRANDGDAGMLSFQKELSSSGNVNTADVLFPGMPFQLWANPELLRLSLEPLLAFQEAGLYPNGYAMHDMGARFPFAVGHVEGDDEAMPVEECGNMILMCYAYHRFVPGGAVGWLDQHYNLLRRWAEYLVEYALVPAAQLSTDDFADTLANQTNLAIKGIVGLKAMSAVAGVTGRDRDAERFARTASEYYAQWEELAIDPSGSHALLAYQWRSSWGLLYNVFPDMLLDLGVVGRPVYEMQCRWYPQVSQIFGVPLDSRHHYTKSDWMMWVAATCDSATRSMLVNGVAYWLNQTTTGDPFSDLFETIGTGFYPTSPDSIHFKARPVVGGHYALLALLRNGSESSSGNEG